MSTHIEYSTEKQLDDAVQQFMETSPIGLAVKEHVKIAACFIIRMDDDDATQPGKNDPVAIKKVPPDMKCLMRSKADFLLVVDYHFWQTSADEVKRGHMAQAVSRIKVERGEKSVKIGTRKYDLVTNLVVLKHHGLFTESMAMAGEIISTMPKALSMIYAVVERQQAKDAPPADEPEDEKPRVVARTPAKTKAAKKPTPPMSEGGDGEQVEEPVERTRPARRIPPDPEPSTSANPAAEEPEPED